MTTEIDRLAADAIAAAAIATDAPRHQTDVTIAVAAKPLLAAIAACQFALTNLSCRLGTVNISAATSAVASATSSINGL